MNPPIPLAALRSHLSVTVPKFAAASAQPHLPGAMPLPLEAVASSDVVEIVGNYDRRTPLSAVAWWWKLLEDVSAHADRLDDAVSDPGSWPGGFRAAADRLREMSMTTAVAPEGEAPHTVVWVMFADVRTATSARLLAPVPARDACWVEVARSPDGLWRVAGLAKSPGGVRLL